MGMDQRVKFSSGTVPPWPAVRDFLAERKFPVQMRMIDGQLSFPDEEPPAEWRELRVGTPQGMITLRREAAEVVFVIWGNADGPMLQAWNVLTWAFAEVGGGQVQTAQGVCSATEFRNSAELPIEMR